MRILFLGRHAWHLPWKAARWERVAAIGPLVLLLCTLSRADEAVLTDGRRIQGTLTFAKEGRLHFSGPGWPGTRSLADIQHVSFAKAATPPLLAATVHQVLLSDGQRLTGELISMDGERILLRTIWRQRLCIPRAGVTAVRQPAGWATFWDEDFESGLTSWKVTAGAALTDRQHVSGKQSLVLSAPGQRAEYGLLEPLQAGRVGVNFHDPGEATGARWVVEAAFGTQENGRVVKLILAGAGPMYAVDNDPDEVGRLPRTAGWHRVEFRFSPDYLLAGVDGNLLAGWKQGPGSPLRKLSLACESVPGGKGVRDEVCFDDLGLARSVADLPHHQVDDKQDELWLLTGDQWFGRVVRADRRRLDIEGRFGTRAFPWGEVRGIFLRHEVQTAQTADGEQVRLWLRSGAAAEPDELEGALRGLDERHVTLQHPLLGELVIDRGRLQRLRGLLPH